MRTSFIPLDANCRVRTNTTERALLEQIKATESLESLSETVRLIIKEAARARGLYPPVVVKQQSEKPKETFHEQCIENFCVVDSVS